MLVFFEVHWMVDGGVCFFCTGAFFMVRVVGLLIVFVVVRGMYYVFFKGSLRVIFGYIDVYVGLQFEIKDFFDEEVHVLVEQICEIIIIWIGYW